MAALAAGESDLVRLDEKLGNVLYAAGRHDDALRVLGRAVAAYESLYHLEGAGRATAKMGAVYRRRGTSAEGLDLLASMTERLSGKGRSPALAALDEQFESAQRVLNEALSIAAPLQVSHSEARILEQIELGRHQTGDGRGSSQYLARALAIIRRLGAKKDIERIERLREAAHT
jgi:tetratricopeptide (TPR) repeat protein